MHWLTDVLGGLALGWGWFALCATAFGGWRLRLGAPVEQAAGMADAMEQPAPPLPHSRGPANRPVSRG
jgi:ABC-type uncharacterized transport system permease subunit